MSQPLLEAKNLIFRGINAAECDEFIAGLMEKAFDAGKLRDNAWIADFAMTCFREDARRWYSTLDENTQSDWRLLQRAMLAAYPMPPSSTSVHVLSASVIPTPAAAPPRNKFFTPAHRSPSRSPAWSVLPSDEMDDDGAARLDVIESGGFSVTPLSVRSGSPSPVPKQAATPPELRSVEASFDVNRPPAAWSVLPTNDGDNEAIAADNRRLSTSSSSSRDTHRQVVPQSSLVLVEFGSTQDPLVAMGSIAYESLSRVGVIAANAKEDRRLCVLKGDYRGLGRIRVMSNDAQSIKGYLHFQIHRNTGSVIPRICKGVANATPVWQMEQTQVGDFKLVLDTAGANEPLRTLGFYRELSEWNFTGISANRDWSSTSATDCWRLGANSELFVRFPMEEFRRWSAPTSVAFKWDDSGVLSGSVVNERSSERGAAAIPAPPSQSHTRLFFEPLEM